MEYILIIIMHIGALDSKESNAITTAVFSSKENCEAAGNQASKLVRATAKKIEYICAKK